MTTRQKFEEMLFNMGVFESQATQIMDLAIPRFQELLPQYQVTWERPASKYPDAFYNAGFMSVVKGAALDWIDENLPNAWFRALFA
jgi:hypothetical protein